MLQLLLEIVFCEDVQREFELGEESKVVVKDAIAVASRPTSIAAGSRQLSFERHFGTVFGTPLTSRWGPLEAPSNNELPLWELELDEVVRPAFLDEPANEVGSKMHEPLRLHGGFLFQYVLLFHMSFINY